MKYKQIIWDWNGTLFDDVEICIDIMNTMLLKRNLPILTIDEYKKKFCFPIKQYYKNIGWNFDKDPFEEISIEFFNEYENQKKNCFLHSNCIEILSFFKNLNCNQIIISAYNHNYLLDLVKDLNLDSFFSEIIGLNNIYAESKKSLVQNWVNNSKFEKKHILLIGDTLHDFEVANESGIDCLLISNGHHDHSTLQKCGVTIIKRLIEIKTLF